MPSQRKNYKIILFASLTVLFLAIYYILNLSFFSNWSEYIPFARKLSITICFISLCYLIGRIIEKLVDKKLESDGVQHNFRRIIRLLVAVSALTIVVAFLFQSLYAVALSFGLFSLVLSFALQKPITSFIAWIYIVFRKPYKVGDRIQINSHKGDIIEINYLDTTIQEFSGEYLKNDRKSGRLIHFPNSIIFEDKVINYSGQFVPFIWNETALQISYTSDLEFVESCLVQAATEDFKEQYPNKNIRGNEPAIYYRNNEYAWMEAVVSYPVEPFDTTGRRNRILRKALPLLNAQPEKVGFPEGIRR